MSNLAPCAYQDKCSGCSFWPIPLETQRQNKVHDFKLRLQNQELFNLPTTCLGPRHVGVRDRLDFSFKAGVLGLYNKNIDDRRELVDIETCAVATPELNNALNELRQLSWPFSVASFRLRIGPQGQKGLWIDCANVDIKVLLSNAEPLKSLRDRGFFIEIGQKGKSPVWRGEQWKLEKITPEYFFLTWHKEEPISLRSPVSSFTQPGRETNKYLYQAIKKLLGSRRFKTAIEFGAGIGNLTFPLLEFAEKITAYEFDESALESLHQTLRDHPEIHSRIHLVSGDFQNRLQGKELQHEAELALVNPPRSGLKDFVTHLNQTETIQKVIYVSCFPESFFADIKNMENHFRIENVLLVDQFPMTPHYEIVALLERVKS